MSTIGKMKANNAFTLIEILLVVIIIGIVLALAAPNFSKGFARFQLNKTADDLLSCSRWAQAMAIGQGRIYALTFSNGLISYRLTVDQGSFSPVNGTLGRMHPIPDSIRLVITQPHDPQGTGNVDHIEFYPDGTIDPATIQINSAENKTVLSTAVMSGMMTKVESE
jgi:prepilin-type N-terminal cleavage/methylation domain-containing protein